MNFFRVDRLGDGWVLENVGIVAGIEVVDLVDEGGVVHWGVVVVFGEDVCEAMVDFELDGEDEDVDYD